MSFLSDAHIVARELDRYYRDSVSRRKRVIAQPPLKDLVIGLGLEAWARTGGLTGRKLSVFIRRYLESTTRLHHPAYMAHQVAAPCHAGALAALVDGYTNNAMAIYEMGPAASAIEYFVVNWMTQKIGWTPAPYPGGSASGKTHAGGVLTHGGSLANLTALIAARSRTAPEIWEEGYAGNLALLAPAGAHYSIARAAGIMGIGGKAVYPLPVDGDGRVIPGKIAATLRRVKADGRKPFALAASACSTAVGIFDPLRAIGEICAKHRLWFHVDGAHGASVLLSAAHRKLLDGIELADSVVWDAHKLMRTPTLCAAVLVKDARHLDRAFHQEASYLFHAKEQPGFDFLHRTVECTKAGLGLRFFAVLASLGEPGLGKFVDRQIALAREAWAYISEQPEFTCAVQPECNIVCFRLEGSDEMQLKVRNAILAEGRYYLSTTTFNGKRYLRLALMNPLTSLKDVIGLIGRIRRMAAKLQAA